ncbi:MAG: SpoVR family protein, partial [Chloroflexota bacterium]
VPAHIMYEFGAYGLPSRFSHWTHGRTYQELKTMYDYGLNKIYELVINTDPCFAFLLESNSILQNKLVVAHVLAHADFFKNNVYFQQTDRDMLERAGVNADRIRRYEFQHGRLEVEQFLDAVLAIQEHVDPNQIVRARQHRAQSTPPVPLRRPKGGHYDDLLSGQELAERAQTHTAVAAQPVDPERDILLYLMQNASGLAEWQRDILGIVRSETLYFLPQMRTKIMNEGWASFWHARIMRELDLGTDEVIEFARLHANVLAPSGKQINPYHVGVKMLEDIERRWDNPTLEERNRLGRTPGQGRAKIFEVRETESDVSFLRNYLTKDLVGELELQITKPGEGEEGKPEEATWQEIRDFLVNSLINFGHPFLQVESGDFHGQGELFIRHVFDGQELDLKYAERTLPYLYRLWGRPVHVETTLEDKQHLLTFDGGPDGMKTEPL